MKNSLTQYLIESVKSYSNKIAIICHEQQVTYQQLFDSAMQLAAFFKMKGLQRGDRVLVSLVNSVDTIICFWATLLADGVICIIDYKQSQEKIAYILADSAPKIVVSKNSLLNTNIANLVIINDIADIQIESTDIKSKHLDIDLAAIIYTSGSTGEPKGVMLTHRNMLAASDSINAYLSNTSDDRVISVLPLSFDYGLYQMILMVMVGGTLILEQDFIFPSRFLKRIAELRPTALPLVPSMVPLLKKFNELRNYDLNSIRYVTNTGSALLPEHIITIQNLFKQAQVFSMYGLTECKRCTYLPPQDLQRKSGSIGLPIPNTEMWIVDESGNRLGPNLLGEMVVRGQTVMKGYWNKPEFSQKKLKVGLLPGEMVLYTGDYGTVDHEGYFYFYGRIDEVIKSRGMKVSPLEIESILMKREDIVEVAAVPVEHEAYGYAIVLFVNVTNVRVSREILIEYCRDKLQSHQQPVNVIILNSLPKTTNGKINKRLLTAQYQSDLRETTC